VALSVAAILLIPASGSAQGTLPTIVRANPLQVTLTVTPRRDRTRPFTFTSTGRVRVPTRLCNPGESPITGRCIPILCPPGATDINYCLRPGIGVICSGIVTVRFQKRTTTISSRNVFLRRDCTYRSRVTFRTRLITRVGNFRVRARFQGNVVLNPRTSRTRVVRAG
jgi:hypothetical protein